MSEIAIISTREVIYEPSLQKSGKIKVTLKISQNLGCWNLDVKYFGVREIKNVEESYNQVDFIKEKKLVKTDTEINQLFSLVNKTISPNEFPEKFYEIQRDALLMYVQNDTLENGDCIFGIKPSEWVIFKED